MNRQTFSFPQLILVVAILQLLLLLLLWIPSTGLVGVTAFHQYSLFFPARNVGSYFFVKNESQRRRGNQRTLSLLPSSTLMMSSSSSSTTTSSTTDQDQREISRKHSIFSHTNAVSKYMPVPHPNIWRTKLLIPSSSLSSTLSLSLSRHTASSPSTNNSSLQTMIIHDVRIEFTDPMEGAQQLLRHCGFILPEDIERRRRENEDDANQGDLSSCQQVVSETMNHLAHVLSYFQSIVSSSTTPFPNDMEEKKYNTNDNDVVVDDDDDDESVQLSDKNSTNPPPPPPRQEQRTIPRLVPCVARIVSSIGPSGTKCPRWHVDHVPVRMVMSFIGPGCEYVQEKMEDVEDMNDNDGGRENTNRHGGRVIVNRNALNNFDEVDTTKANEIIVQKISPSNIVTQRSIASWRSVFRSLSNQNTMDEQCCCTKDGTHHHDGDGFIATLQYAKEGEAVLLMGKDWEDQGSVDDDDDDDDHDVQDIIHPTRMRIRDSDREYNMICHHDPNVNYHLRAAVHRSPKMRPKQERILLTVDLA